MFLSVNLTLLSTHLSILMEKARNERKKNRKTMQSICRFIIGEQLTQEPIFNRNNLLFPLKFAFYLFENTAVVLN